MPGAAGILCDPAEIMSVVLAENLWDLLGSASMGSAFTDGRIREGVRAPMLYTHSRPWRKSLHPRLPGAWSTDAPFRFQLMLNDVVAVD